MPRTLLAALCLATPTLAQVAPDRTPEPQAGPKVQIALLLDTSNSMDGLIDQAKAQLWNLVNELVLAEHQGKRPTFEVALIEYGNNRLHADTGHIRIVTPLTTDLDLVSQELFALSTLGGDEFCGQAIQKAADAFEWSSAPHDLRVIFIAGNEPFTQGPVDFRSACASAIARGICVNTIFCGPESEGSSTGWSEGARLADGSYSFINQDQAVPHIPAPQDDELAQLGVALNETYIAFGAHGAEGRERQQRQDANAESAAPAAAGQRAVAKASTAYRNSSWDLVDACRENVVNIEDVKEEDLPEDLRKMTMDERKAHVAACEEKRGEIAGRIADLETARKKYIAEKLREMAGDDQTLGAALVKAVREQASRKGYEFRESLR